MSNLDEPEDTNCYCPSCRAGKFVPDEYAEETNAAMNYGDGYENAIQAMRTAMRQSGYTPETIDRITSKARGFE
jgi:hypothetical protein